MIPTLEQVNAVTMTAKEVMVYLDVTEARIYALSRNGQVEKLKGGGFYRPSIEAYKATRNRKGGRPPKNSS